MACPNHPEVVSGLVACGRCGQQYCPDCVVEIGGKPYDAACKDEQIRDLKSGSVGLDLATAGRRFLGAFIDSALFIPLAIYAAFKFPGTGLFHDFVPRLVLPAVLWILYEALMLRSGGQTVGKKVVGTKVVSADGAELSEGQAWSRAGSRQLMAVTQILGLIDPLFIFSEGRRTLHDRVGKTVVVNWKR